MGEDFPKIAKADVAQEETDVSISTLLDGPEAVKMKLAQAVKTMEAKEEEEKLG